jgi:polysaccharide pyruvyl transferase WcaK-like protein
VKTRSTQAIKETDMTKDEKDIVIDVMGLHKTVAALTTKVEMLERMLDQAQKQQLTQQPIQQPIQQPDLTQLAETVAKAVVAALAEREAMQQVAAAINGSPSTEAETAATQRPMTTATQVTTPQA